MKKNYLPVVLCILFLMVGIIVLAAGARSAVDTSGTSKKISDIKINVDQDKVQQTKNGMQEVRDAMGR